MEKLTIDDLNKKYSDSDQVDQALFAEQRSNVLLITGEHYANRGSRFYNSIRDQKELSKEQKIRLTKNHIQRIVKTYVNNILTYAPGVKVSPKNQTEMQDIKSAELHDAVLTDIKERHKVARKIRQWAEDYCGIGEVAVKLFWDPMAGEFKGYKQSVDEFGMPEMDENGEPKSSGDPVFAGDLVFERIFGFNLFRPVESKDMEYAEWIGLRKMVDVDELKMRIGGDEEKLKIIEEGKDETYLIFNPENAGFTESKGQVMLREYYFRPSPVYPMGYYYITTPHGILWEGELPFGIYPIKFTTFEDMPTSPRGRSIVKTCRPYQAEINRAASKMAEHQITLGDDKLIYQAGAKLTNGSILPGVRGIQVTGQAPTVLAGRDGSQYLNYMQSQIAEMYQAAMLEEDIAEKPSGQIDPYAMLFQSLRHKKRFSTYAVKFEQFLVDVFETALDLSRHYMSDDAVIYAVGRREQINIPEFKNSSKLCYQIKVEAQLEDIDSKMGKQLMMNHILQYVGPQLGKDDIGKIIKNMPYANVDETFGDLTLDYEDVKNDMLALERGEFPVPNPKDNHEYYIKRLTSRMKQADFRYLAQPVKQNYEKKLRMHEQLLAEQMQKLQQMQAGFIPIGGAMIACEMYVNDPQQPDKLPKRVRVPYQALDWLIKALEKQGMTLQKLEQMQKSAQAEVSGMMPGQQQPSGPQGVGPMQKPAVPTGAEMPRGVSQYGRSIPTAPSGPARPVFPPTGAVPSGLGPTNSPIQPTGARPPAAGYR